MGTYIKQSHSQRRDYYSDGYSSDDEPTMSRSECSDLTQDKADENTPKLIIELIAKVNKTVSNKV